MSSHRRRVLSSTASKLSALALQWSRSSFNSFMTSSARILAALNMEASFLAKLIFSSSALALSFDLDRERISASFKAIACLFVEFTLAISARCCSVTFCAAASKPSNPATVAAHVSLSICISSAWALSICSKVSFAVANSTSTSARLNASCSTWLPISTKSLAFCSKSLLVTTSSSSRAAQFVVSLSLAARSTSFSLMVQVNFSSSATWAALNSWRFR
mmetsp:Transcript_64297/g.170309  ORF Transcript_64297/g.170309 Transcript_64297/m.170309 type:complete len:218 (-) Transcript_64297:1009-1662(-)